MSVVEDLYISPALPTDDYIKHLISTGKISASALYRSLLFSFQAWLKNQRKGLNEATPVLVEQYLYTLNSQSAIDGTLAAIRGYFKYRYQSLPMGDPNMVLEMQRSNQMEAIAPKRKPKELKKKSLSPRELKSFFQMLHDSEVRDELYSGFVVLFYFGARASEFARYLASADIDFDKREMKIQTCKTHVERYLAWDKRLDLYLIPWYDFVMKNKGEGLNYPGQWLTKTMKTELGRSKVMIGGAAVTSRTARSTFETQMRLAGVQDIVIRAILGHTDHSISDVYTDWTQFVPHIKEALLEKHFMLVNKVI